MRILLHRKSEAGKVGWILLWLLGIPIPVLFLFFCSEAALEFPIQPVLNSTKHETLHEVIMKHLITIAGAVLPLCVFLAACNDSRSTRTEPERSATVTPDNTTTNARNRSDATLTPGDQGETSADREVTQKIRKALVIDASGYSTTAKNIKIMTVNGKVTLRGPVQSDAEKMGIVAIARNVAGEGNVDDQLEVKANL